MPFPPTVMAARSLGDHVSITTDLTNVMCVPRPRWWPEQSRQTKMPNRADAHDGDFWPQSKQDLLSALVRSRASAACAGAAGAMALATSRGGGGGGGRRGVNR